MKCMGSDSMDKIFTEENREYSFDCNEAEWASDKLPFVLQENIGDGRKLIEKLDIVSIQEWNDNTMYGKYPIRPVRE